MTQRIDGLGLWVSPHARVLEVTTHIASICRYPEAFGVDPDELHALFLAHQEPLEFEGKARRVVLERMIDRGWVRVRHYRIHGWTVNVAALSGWYRGLITSLFQYLYAGGQHAFDDVKLDGYWGILRRDAQWFVRGGLLAGADDVPDPLPTLTVIDRPDQIPPEEIVPVRLRS